MSESLKHCPVCKQDKPLTAFYKERSRKDGHKHQCKDCHKNTVAIGRRKLKEETYIAYGGISCSNCDEDFFEVLVLDHIEGGGNKERSKLKKSGTQFFYHLKKNGYPPGYQVLCHHCNVLKYSHPELLEEYARYVKGRRSSMGRAPVL